jgi:hypothetical protein
MVVRPTKSALRANQIAAVLVDPRQATLSPKVINTMGRLIDFDANLDGTAHLVVGDALIIIVMAGMLGHGDDTFAVVPPRVSSFEKAR